MEIRVRCAREEDSMDIHSNSLLLSATDSLWQLGYRHFAKCTINSTTIVIVLDANHVVDRVGAGNICVPVVGQTLYDGICASELCCFVYEVQIGRMIGVSKCNVVFDLDIVYSEAPLGRSLGDALIQGRGSSLETE